LIDVILTSHTRMVCSHPQLFYYSGGGVVLSLIDKGFEARLTDLTAHKDKDFAGSKEHKPADMYCYAVFFGNKVSAFQHMRDARGAKEPPKRIIAFGPFASVFAEEILSRGLADIVVAADPEFVIPMIASEGASSLLQIPNVMFMQDGKIISTPKRSFHELDSIPFISPFFAEQKDGPAFILTARGCQYHCVFCDRNVLWGGGVRNRSVENVLEEIQEVVSKYHVREIRFLDEDLAADRKRLARLCDGMRRMTGEFKWECSACVNSVSKELLLLMGHSRCGCIDFGMESASPNVLRRIGKRYSRQDILNAVRWARAANIQVEMMVTMGNPHETDSDKYLTLSLLKELGREIDSITTNRLVILPGTPLFRQSLREGRFTRESFFDHEGIIYYDEQHS
jgi:anaerobic magnesium-protoporphyrin IX monomethyl ester cyclase